MRKRLLRILGAFLIAVSAALLSGTSWADQSECDMHGEVVAGATFEFGCVAVSGVSVYDPAKLWQFALAFASRGGTEVSTTSLGDAIEQIYHEDGYFLARARILPSRDNRTLVIQVSEGRVTEISVTGVDDALGKKIAGYVSRALGVGPAQQLKFERGLMLAGDLSGVSVTSEFTPDDTGDGNRLHISARQDAGVTTIAADTVPGIDGRIFGAVALKEVYSTLTAGDLIRGYIGSETTVGDGTIPYGGLYYRAPVGKSGAYWEGYAGSAAYSPNNIPGDNENWHADVNAFAVAGHPVLRDLHQYLYVIGMIDYYRGDLVDTNADSSTALRAILVHSMINARGDEFKYAFRLSGGTADGPSSNTYYSDSFWSIRAATVATISLDNLVSNAGMRIEGLAQYSSDALPYDEELFFGDRYKNRGYPIGLLSADSGFSGTLQFRRNFEIDTANIASIDPYVFFDGGFAKDNAYGGIDGYSQWLASAGAGVAVFFEKDIALDAWLAFPLINEVADETIGPGLYVGVSKSW